MKNQYRTWLVWAAAVLGMALLPTVAGAASIYSDDFSGSSSTNLNGTTPDVTQGSNTWTASTAWKADGSTSSVNNVNADNSAFLAFTPTSGNVYTLTATLTQPSGGHSSGGWAAIGFTADNETDQTFFASPNNAAPWVLYRPNSNTDSFLGPQTGGTADEGNHAGSAEFKIVLDTTGAAWKAQWFIDGSSVRTATYGSNPTINYVGLSRDAGVATDFSSFVLSDNTTGTSPEIAVSGNANDIADGDASPSLADFTDFGTTSVGSPIQRTFRVDNTGTAALTTSGLVLPGGFSLFEGLDASIAAGGFDTFTVQLDALTAGIFSGDISFTNNDANENPFNFAITGEVEAINVIPAPAALPAGLAMLGLIVMRRRRA